MPFPPIPVYPLPPSKSRMGKPLAENPPPPPPPRGPPPLPKGLQQPDAPL